MAGRSLGSGLVTLGVGALMLAFGAWAWSGRGIRRTSSSIFGRPAVFFAAGVFFAAAGAHALAKRADLGPLAALAAAVFAAAAIATAWFMFVGTPSWAAPAWQREMSR